jgi:hypothetical protein
MTSEQMYGLIIGIISGLIVYVIIEFIKKVTKGHKNNKEDSSESTNPARNSVLPIALIAAFCLVGLYVGGTINNGGNANSLASSATTNQQTIPNTPTPTLSLVEVANDHTNQINMVNTSFPESSTLVDTALSPFPEPTLALGNAWVFDDNARTMTWVGPTDGSEDIWQADGEPIQKIRAGYTAYFSIDVSMKMKISIGTVDGKLISRQAHEKTIVITAGKHSVVSRGPQGGFRVFPE